MFESAALQKNKILVPPGSIITLIGSYIIPTLFGIKGKVFRLKTEWQVVEWSDQITVYQFVYSFVNTVLLKTFCSVQSTQVRWVKISFSVESFYSSINLNSLSGQINLPGSNVLLMNMVSALRPKNRYSLQIRGIPNEINVNDRTKTNEYTERMVLLERVLTTNIRIPIFSNPECRDLLDFIADSPKYIRVDSLNSAEYNEALLVSGEKLTKVFDPKSNSEILFSEKSKKSQRVSKTGIAAGVSVPSKVTTEKSSEVSEGSILGKKEIDQVSIENFDNIRIIVRFVKVVSRSVATNRKSKKDDTTRIVKRKLVEVNLMDSASIIASLSLTSPNPSNPSIY